MQVRAGCLAGEADGRNHFPLFSTLAGFSADASGLEVFIECNMVVSNFQCDVISGCIFRRAGGMTGEGRAFCEIIPRGQHRAIGHRYYAGAIPVPVFYYVIVPIRESSQAIQLNKVNSITTRYTCLSIYRINHPAMAPLP